MTRNQLLAVCIAAVVLLAGIGTIGYVSTVRYERDAEINAQTEIAKSKIVEAERTKRAVEHTKWLPWN